MEGEKVEKKKAKRCYHNRIRIIVENCGGGIESCFCLICLDCKAVKNSIDCSAKWKKGDPTVLIDELANDFHVKAWKYF